MSCNPFRFPLSFSLLVGIEVWDHQPMADDATLDVAVKLAFCDAAVDVYGPVVRDEHTRECLAAAVGLVLAGVVTP